MPRKQYDTVQNQRNLLWSGVFKSAARSSEASVEGERYRRLLTWRQDPWAFLTGRDLPGAPCPRWCPDYGKNVHSLDYEHPIIWTTDERDDERAVKPFPEEKEYLRHLTWELMQSPYRIIFAEKSRQMYFSYLAMLLGGLWYPAFFDEREVVVSKLNEGDAIKLINDKIRDTHRRMPEWLRDELPMKEQPAKVILFERTRSTVTAVAQNFAFSTARGITGSLVILDEAAYQPYLPEIMRAIQPMAVRIWGISTANIGNPGAEYMRQVVTMAKPGAEDVYVVETPEEAQLQEKGMLS